MYMYVSTNTIFMYSLTGHISYSLTGNMHVFGVGGNNVGTAGAQALAEGLQHCTNLQKLK